MRIGNLNFFLIQVLGTVPQYLPISHILPISLYADNKMNNVKYIIKILEKKENIIRAKKLVLILERNLYHNYLLNSLLNLI